METKNKKTYDFGEKKEEIINGKKLPVEWITPKYKEAKNKAIELLESEKYKDVLEASDYINDIKPSFAIPIHYGKIIGDFSLEEEFLKNVHNSKVLLMVKER